MKKKEFPKTLESLQERLGYHFKDEALLKLALTHASCGHEAKRKAPDNQRLEFLGDAVLQLCLTHYLYKRFAQLEEGPMTKLRSQVVSRPFLARLALALELGQYLLLGRGEEISGGRARESNLADAMEAVIGAIFEEAGFEKARQSILQLLQQDLEQLEKNTFDMHNPKGFLQEILQAQNKGTPIYELIEEIGPDHDKTYTVTVKLDATQLGQGQGKSKKLAEVSAAIDALHRLGAKGQELI